MDVTWNSLPLTTETSPLSQTGQHTDHRDAITDCCPHDRQTTSAGTVSSSSWASGMDSYSRIRSQQKTNESGTTCLRAPTWTRTTSMW